MVSECFMNLECKYVWEKEIVPGDDHVMLCLEVIGIHIDEDHMPDRTGENGILYNIHYQMNPEKVTKTGHDYAAVLNPHPDIVAKPLADKDDTGQTVYLVWDKTTVLTQASQKFRSFLLDWLPKNGKDKVCLA